VRPEVLAPKVTTEGSQEPRLIEQEAEKSGKQKWREKRNRLKEQGDQRAILNFTPWPLGFKNVYSGECSSLLTPPGVNTLLFR
jgi:hypothetical protein